MANRSIASTLTDPNDPSPQPVVVYGRASDGTLVTQRVNADGAQSAGYSASVSITRPNDTSAYLANDVIGSATGSTACIEFTSMGPSAGRVLITSASLEVDATALISGEANYRLHLYSVTAPSALGDNAAFDLPSGDRASYLGYIDMGTPVDLGSTLYVEANAINKQIKLAGTSIFAYLVTIGAFTPAAQTVRKVTLHAISV